MLNWNNLVTIPQYFQIAHFLFCLLNHKFHAISLFALLILLYYEGIWGILKQKESSLRGIVFSEFSCAIVFCLCSPKFAFWKPNAQGGGTSRKWLGCEGQTLMHEIDALIKEAPEDSLLPPQRTLSSHGERALTQPCWTLI